MEKDKSLRSIPFGRFFELIVFGKLKIKSFTVLSFSFDSDACVSVLSRVALCFALCEFPTKVVLAKLHN